MVNVSYIEDYRKEPKRELLAWECQCGSTAFLLLSDGSAECRHCQSVVNEARIAFIMVAQWASKSSLIRGGTPKPG